MIFCTECGIDIEDIFSICDCENILNWSMFSESVTPEFSLVIPRNFYFMNFSSSQVFYLDNDRNIVLNER